jgi:hypothetical protein
VIRRALIVLLVLGAVMPAAAFAAALGVSAQRLTSFEGATSVPIAECTLEPVADTYADGPVLLRNSNFGSSTDLVVRSALTGDGRAFARFDLSACSIPSNAEIETARLDLYLATAPLASRTHQAHRVTTTWGETTLTWNNQPAVAGTVTSSTSTGTTSDVTISWDVLADVQAFVAGTETNHGWRIKDSSEGSAVAQAATFGARERVSAGQRPSLAITYYP